MTQNGANSILDSVRLALNEVKQAADSQTIIGDPITVGETTRIPVSKISIGVGLGGGTYGKEAAAGKNRCGHIPHSRRKAAPFPDCRKDI